MPPWPSLVIGFLGPLCIAWFAKFIDLSERPRAAAVHFLTGAVLAFVALVTERYVFHVFGPSIPARYHLAVEAFLFIALTEEAVKIAQISELARRNALTLRQTISSGITVAAGFAGAENVIYLFRYSEHVDGLLLIRTLTANPMHLAVAVIASSYVHEGLRDEAKSHYLALAVLVATMFHGLYDYLIMSSSGRTFGFIFVLVFAVSWAWRLTPLPDKSG